MNDVAGDALVARAANVTTAAEFGEFVRLLLQNLREHPEEWDNKTLEDFIEGASGFAEGIQGYYLNVGEAVDLSRPSWRVLANVLLAARVYE